MRAYSKLLLVALVVVLALFIFAPSQTFAQSHNSVEPKVSNASYVIKWMDQHGQVIKTWQGSKSEADRIKAQERKKLSLQNSRASKQAKVVIPYINQVQNCAAPNDFFDLYFPTGVICLANAGYLQFYYTPLYGVTEIDSGNNHGSVTYCSNPHCPSPNYGDMEFPICSSTVAYELTILATLALASMVSLSL